MNAPEEGPAGASAEDLPRASVLIVDDDQIVARLCRDALGEDGSIAVTIACSGGEGVERLRSQAWDLVVADINLPDIDGLQVLEHAKSCDPELPVIIITGYPTLETSIECLRLGASDYVLKPILPDDFLLRVRRALDERRLRDENRLLRRQTDRPGDRPLLGQSPGIKRVTRAIDRYAQVEADVLILGETGTGKELVARSIHQRSTRGGGRFVAVDCGAIPEALMESEFFGHERGAFTGAGTRTLGLLEYADGGTVFLDEIGEMPVALQAKLLRALQERRIRRLGGRREIPIDVRVIAASNRDLVEEIAAGRFREDLYYRIRVGEIKLPPLRDRGDDVLLLVHHFLAQAAREMQRPVPVIEPDALALLRTYDWPGNVRELGNTMRRLVMLLDGDRVRVEDLPEEIPLKASAAPATDDTGFFALRTRHLEAFERPFLEEALEHHHGDVSAVGRRCGIPRRTLYRLLDKYGLDPDRFRPQR